MYTEIAISNGPGILLVHVVVPGDVLDGPMDVVPFIYDGVARWCDRGGYDGLYIDSEPVSRERFLDWAQTA